MPTDSITDGDNESTADVTDDSCNVQYIEIVPLTRDTDGPCIAECDSGDWSAEVKQEIDPVIKQEPEPEDGLVCSTVILYSGDYAAELEHEMLPAVKQEPDDVCKYW